MNNKYISILIPLYNGIEFLEDSVNSVINQTYKNWELLIGINGKYEDNDFNNEVKKIINNLINKNKDKELDINIKNFNFKGKVITLNNLILDVKYNYIALLDVDDIWVNNKLELQVDYLDDYDIVGTKCEYIGDIINFSPDIPLGCINNYDFFKSNPIINSSVIIKKKDAHWIDDINIILEDYDMWFRLKFEKKSFYNINKILCFHRIHKKSAFNTINSNNINILKNKWLNIKYLIE